MKTVYVSIGNSDDKLTQREWANFFSATYTTFVSYAEDIHGVWFSDPTGEYQNACFCVEVQDDDHDLREDLRILAGRYQQDNIKYDVVDRPEFLWGVT